MLIDYFSYVVLYDCGDVFFMCGIEGEIVVNVWCVQCIDWFSCGICIVLVEKQSVVEELFDLFEGQDVVVMVVWINEVLVGQCLVL